jgi:uncharacterized protein (DUF169 family)
MPFKSPKLIYGLPQDAYPQESVNAFTADLTCELSLKRRPVGVKLFFDKAEFDAVEVPEVRSALPYCVMVKQASEGKGCRSRLEQHKCDGGTTALGLEKSTERIESGTEYFSYHLYATPAAARRHRSHIHSLHRELPLTYGLLVQPLASFVTAPDIIILIVDAYQAMRLVQGYSYETGLKPQIDLGAMQGMCSECSAYPYLSGSMNVSVLCPSTRVLCGWEHCEMAIGIPFEQYRRIVSGVVSTSGTCQ